MQQLLDETLTEMQTQEDLDDDMPDMEMHHFGVAPSLTKRSDSVDQ